MNQDSNFNQNNFNYQGNNGMPNNQQLNNQTFNQNMNVNQQAMPSFQQPIKQEPIPQTTNTFDSGSANNKSFNGKVPKKINLGLIIGIGIGVVVISLVVFMFINNGTKNNSIGNSKIINCTFDGELVQGAEYVNGQYTYRYKEENASFGWINIDMDGWGVRLTDKNSTEPVTTELCTYINDKPIVSMYRMFSGSNAKSIDLSSFNTKNVTNMGDMFAFSDATSLDLSSFDTENVTNMSSMFNKSAAKSIDLSSFNTKNVTTMGLMFLGSAATTLDLSSFDTRNVTNMFEMFMESEATTIDLSGFDLSNNNIVTKDMFYKCKATKGYARTQNDADILNDSRNKPDELTFVVK